MSELARILALWREAKTRDEDWVLATVVRVEGSSYRKPGARMLITATQRAGTISGGCLEAELVRKAFWLTADGPAIETYQGSFDEDGSAPFGLGCGGTITVLLERGESGDPVLQAMDESVSRQTCSAIVTVIDTNSRLLSRRLILFEDGSIVGDLLHDSAAMSMANQTLAGRHSSYRTLKLGNEAVEVFAEFIPRATSLIVFGAGDDAQPVVEAASALGWLVAVADGRANLIRRERFPTASLLINTNLKEPLLGLDIRRADAAVLMSHSYEQDLSVLTALLRTQIVFIGVLGPRHRTVRLVADAAIETGLDAEECLQRLHAPVGLDVGADSPASIALAIVAEVHAVLKVRSAAPLRGQAIANRGMKTPIELPV